MKGCSFLLLGLVVTLNSLTGTEGSKKFEFHYLKTVKMNDTDDFFTYDLKKVEKVNETTFEVDCDSELFVPLDNEWHMWIQVFHNKDGEEDFPEKPMFQLPKTAFCNFMNSTYRHHMFDSIKGHSNLPQPDECPVNPKKFQIKDWIFNPGKYSAFAKHGMYRIDMFISQDHEDSHVTKLGLSVYTDVQQVE